MRRAAGLILAGFLGWAAPAQALQVVPSPCTLAIAAEERAAKLPQGLLMAIGFGEAGRRVEGGTTIWPWTVNVEGQGRYFASKTEAVAFVRAQLAAGRRSIDVGCLQVNLRWHPDAFADLDVAFDPVANAAYAARFLRELQARAGDTGIGGWLAAVGSYHSATPARATPYRAHVDRYWQQLADPVLLAALERPSGEPVPSPPSRKPANRNDPFGLELVAYWASPMGLLIGPRDEENPIFDLAPRPVLDMAPSKSSPTINGEAARTTPPKAPSRRFREIRRFTPLPRMAGPPSEPLPRRQGVMARQSATR